MQAVQCAFIPNYEIQGEFVNAVSVSEWGEISKALKNSADTLKAIWQGKEEAAARNFYTVYRELLTGKGYADMVYLPRKSFSENCNTDNSGR